MPLNGGEQCEGNPDETQQCGEAPCPGNHCLPPSMVDIL